MIDDPQDPNPTLIPPDPKKSDIEEVKELFQNTIAEVNRKAQAAEARNRQLEDELMKFRTPKEEVRNDKIPTDDDFWKNPIETLNSLISKQIAPVNQISIETQRATAYTTLKSQYLSYPGFDQIASTVDQMMQGQDPTHANMQIAIQRAVGHLFLSGNLNKPKEEAPNKEEKDPKVLPIRPPDNQAHLRPSAPIVSDNSNNAPKRRALTEDERRLMREFSMSEDQWFNYLEKNNKVDNWKEKAK